MNTGREDGSPTFDLNAMTIEEKVGQMVIARCLDLPLTEKYVRRSVVSGMTPLLTDRTPEEAAEYLNHLQRLSKYPLLFGWSGLSYRGGTDFRFSTAMRLGAARSRELAYLAGRCEAREARAVGFHIVGLPNLDVNTVPDNPIINLRSLGDAPDLVTDLGLELARGAIEGGGFTVGMHFPGHGASASDSHIRVPEIHRSLEELEHVDLCPFRAGIKQGVLTSICTNHCHYPALEPNRVVPATVSRHIVTGLLRERMGYDGIIFSDSLTMWPMKKHYGIEEGAVLAVESGHDLILQDYESDPGITLDALVRAVRSGRIAVAQIDASVRRVMRAKERLGLFENRFVDPNRVATVLGHPEHKSVAKRIARESITVIENLGLPVPHRSARRCVVISNGSTRGVAADLGVSHSPENDFLNESLAQRMPGALSLVLGPAPTPGQVQAALALAREADLVIVGLFSRVWAYAEDHIRLPKDYCDLIRQLAGIGRPMAYLNFGNPWSMLGLPQPGIALCAFSATEDSIEAAIEVLFGEIPSKGRLPVTLSPRYPFGYGL